MKILAYVLVVAGIINALSAAPSLFGGDVPISAVLARLFGVFALLVGGGILMKNRFAWFLGFACILFGSLCFLAEAVPFALQKQGAERAVILVSSVIGGLLVVAFWGLVWYRKRGYFYAEETDA